MKKILNKIIEVLGWVWFWLVAGTLFLVICSTVVGAVAFVLTVFNTWFAPFFAICAIVHFCAIALTIIFAVLFDVCERLGKAVAEKK
jgi:hypothetical protein